MKWKDVKGFEDYYEISSEGSLRRKATGRILKPKRDKDGYLEYCLCVNNKRTYKRGHRLVAIAFIPNLEDKPEVNHKDNIKHNNCIDNLEWVTDSENNRHYYAEFHGPDKGLCTLVKGQWDEILSLHKAGKSYKYIADYFSLGIKRTDTIGDVLAGNRLTSVTGFTSDMRNTVNTVSQKIDDSTVVSLLTDSYIDGITNNTLCKVYSLSPAQVSRIVNGSRRKEIFLKFKKDNNID